MLWLLIALSVPADTIAERFAPPSGFERVQVADDSFAAYLRKLALLPGNPDVLLYDGTRKWNQTAQLAVLAIDVGKQNLQQCADAVIRLMAEFQHTNRQPVCFTATSGDAFPFDKWARGERPTVTKNKVTWSPKTEGGAFRDYLDALFTYAGTISLHRDTTAVADNDPIAIGDIFVQPGSPGHAVIVVDLVSDGTSQRFMLAQSYSPAQQMHVLRNPANPASPWYVPTDTLVTPEWMFEPHSRRRLTRPPCSS